MKCVSLFHQHTQLSLHLTLCSAYSDYSYTDSGPKESFSSASNSSIRPVRFSGNVFSVNDIIVDDNMNLDIIGNN